MQSDLDALVAVAERLADAVRPIVLSRFRRGIAIDAKADHSPVTEADREAEAAMRRLIAEACPGHGILGEEYGEENTDAEWVWVLDPIDGTHSFVTGKPLFGTLVALTRHGEPVLGVIDAPATGERWVGASGRPTTLNGTPVAVRPCAGLGEAWLYATTPHMFAGTDAAAFERLRTACRRTGYGADCYAYGLLAAGHVDLVVEADLKPYDFCALAPVVRGAGGEMTDWQGRPLTLKSDGRVVAAGDPGIGEAARRLLAKS